MDAKALSRQEAAEVLGVSVWSIDRMVEKETLRAISFGLGQRRRHIRIPKAEVDRLLEGTAADAKRT